MRTLSKERGRTVVLLGSLVFAAASVAAAGSCPVALDPIYSRAEALVVDPGQRHLSRAFFNGVYRPGEHASDYVEPDAGRCDYLVFGSGDVAAEDRVNYFRAMAGVPAGVRMDAEFNAKAQEAAMMMSAQGALSHYPDPYWACYSDIGAEAAAASNLSLGSHGPEAISGQMRDNGDNNPAVGHRRWILYPQTERMGIGDMPPRDGFAATNALWWEDARLWSPRPETRAAFVAWPPPGFVPYQVVPGRWSFSYPDADFSEASVSMDPALGPITLEPLDPAPGESHVIGENTLVWLPDPDGVDPNAGDLWPRPDADTTYRVTLRDVLVESPGGPQRRTFSYDVTVFDPSLPASEAATARIEGPTEAEIGADVALQISAVDGAIGYEWRQLSNPRATVPEGAEEGAAAAVIDGTDDAYALIAVTVVSAGDHAFHLAHGPSDPTDQWFELDRDILLGDAATLHFDSRLAWATPDQQAVVQISADDGATWTDVYRQVGTDDRGERLYQARAVDLSRFAGRVVRLRFVYAFDSGSYFSDTDEGVGLHIDNISLDDAIEIDPGCPALAEDRTFWPDTHTSSFQQARPLFWSGYGGDDWGRAHALNVDEGSPAIDVTFAADTAAAGTTVGLRIDYRNETVRRMAEVVLTLELDPRLSLADGASTRFAVGDLPPGDSGGLDLLLRLAVAAPHDAVLGVVVSVAEGDRIGIGASTSIGVDNIGLADTDGDGIADIGDTDDDGDGWDDTQDNCPLQPNPSQTDADGDGIGDVCDALVDRDGDGIADDLDNCPDLGNADQLDLDDDGVGDLCDDLVDRDGDGIADLPAPWIDAAPAFAAPGSSIVANAGASSSPGGVIETYAWTLAGRCRADGARDAAVLSVVIDADAPIAYPPTPCALRLSVRDNGGRVATRTFEITVLPEQHERTMQEAYIAYYGRPADPLGLRYWGALLHARDGDLGALIASYGTSAEYTERFGGLDDPTLINALYLNLFGRDAEPAGLDWYMNVSMADYRREWTDANGGDATRATEYALSRIALDILRGARNEDREIIDHKLEVARYFTEQVVRHGAAYGAQEIDAAVGVLRGVRTDAATVSAAKAKIDATLAGL
jgi:hypothetical protein